jgi:hypothetical protein
MIHAPFDYPNPHAEVCFLIVNVGQDEKVLSAIKEREEDLIKKGFERIIGLRDMYSGEYSKRSPREIDNRVTREFIDGLNSTIQKMSEPSKIRMHIAIMELEAWFLGMYDIFGKINSRLSVDYIEEELGFNLAEIDPQTQFFKPAEEVNRIFQLIGDPDAFNNGRCSSFREFYEEMLN